MDFLFQSSAVCQSYRGEAAGITSVILSHLNLQRLPVDAFN